MNGRVHHPPAGAAVAHAAALAREGDELGVGTVAVLQVQAAVLQDAAGQKSLELVLKDVGQSSVRVYHVRGFRGAPESFRVDQMRWHLPLDLN